MRQQFNIEEEFGQRVTRFLNAQEKGDEPRVIAIRLPGDLIGPNQRLICKNRLFRSEKTPHVIE